ncbi:MAG: H-type lectin domain-containing protein [Melioribacteraceae bacterium]|nr:H-type lectin domain-containing protein [Melioribacteraceae bacterium]MCO6472907.1 H-type lectin domain-containing protein [Melioribacteraceae bacterium]MDD3557213.1 H-type lectin domain-containing protein [Melioribacteraceae bacterium]
MKKVWLTGIVLLMLGLFLNAQAQPQVQSGGYFFDANTKHFTLDKNEGKRTVELEVNFKKPFESKPNVVLSITVLDAVKDTKMRYSVEAVAVSRDGFVVKASVWGDTQLTAIGGNWIAHTE